MRTLNAYCETQGISWSTLSWAPKTWLQEEPGDFDELIGILQSEEAREMYIAKPSNRNKGNGIEVHRSKQPKQCSCPAAEECCAGDTLLGLLRNNQIPDGFIVQNYVADPLLLNGFKFDIRMFMLVATGSPFTAFWWPTGYLRLSLEKYSTDNTDRTVRVSR